jgi:hypothetical protein
MLRQQLAQFCQYFDPTGSDPAIARMVLVGHSMGGLVARLQVSYSGDKIWQAVANRPLEQIVAPPRTKMILAEVAYFEPLPQVTRVVYMATPHGGSALATRLVGRVGSRLVELSSETEVGHDQLVRDNPDAFSDEMARRMPTSVDLLEPTSPLLAAIRHLPTAANVRAHSIIGSGYWMPGSGDSDGVVPVVSAQLPGVMSEKMVFARHVQIHRDDEAIGELIRILHQHLIE